MNVNEPLPELAGVKRAALAAGAVGVLAMLAGVFLGPAQFFRSYLMAWIYWASIGLGCLGLLMVYHLTGGGWGVAIRRLLEAGAGTLPFLAVLFLPLLLGLHDLYEWTHADVVAKDHILQAKAGYLNVPFFIVRAAIYFAVWLTLAFFLLKWSREQDRGPSPVLEDRLRKLSGGGVIACGLAMTFAAFDWMMSLEPHWFSTIYGLIFITSSALGSMSFVVLSAYRLSAREAFRAVFARSILNDLGNLMLAFVMVFAYLSFSQLLIIWSANLPEEIPWYLHRISGGWSVVAIALTVFYFVVPFLLLLGRRNKQLHRRLATLAAAILVARLLDVFFLIGPAFYRERLTVHWMDVAAVVGVGGIFVWLFVWRLGMRPVLPAGDPELAPALARQH